MDDDRKSLYPSQANQKGASLRFFERLNYKWHSLWIRRTSLWPEIQGFSHWFEHEAAKTAAKLNRARIHISLDSKGTVEEVRLGMKKQPFSLEQHQNLGEFLVSLGIRRLILDVRLEKNQIADMLILLYSYREKLEQRNFDRTTPGVVQHLVHGSGVRLACTKAALHDRTLQIDYSYRALQFSRGVQWFEEAHKNFKDHRALLYAAPRYAVLIGVAVIGPIIFYAIYHRNWALVILSMISSLVLLGLVYVFFMIVGSVEYDNEEKAYNLQNAYGKLKAFTNRIHSDVRRARVVQEKFLPDMSQMPLDDRLEWASSFLPAEEIGGDYFDVRTLDHQRAAIIFSDVSGHGMAAAFITAILKTTFQAWVDKEDSLTGLMDRLNLALCRLTPVDSFASVFAAVYDAELGELHYANGGHQPEPWLLPADLEENISFLDLARNLILGVEEQIEFKTSRLSLKPGDVIVFASDGIVENRNIDGELYGGAVFTDFLQQHRIETVARLIQLIEEEMDTYAKNAEQSDDRTILALRVKEIT